MPTAGRNARSTTSIDGRAEDEANVAEDEANDINSRTEDKVGNADGAAKDRGAYRALLLCCIAAGIDDERALSATPASEKGPLAAAIFSDSLILGGEV
jgi:hypothetical protein